MVAKPAAATPEPTETYIIDGVEKVLTKTQARTLIQKAGAVDKRMQETVELKKEIAALRELAETDPEAFLLKVKHDPNKIIEGMLAKRAKQELMTPEQRERAVIEAERDALKAKQDALEKEKLTAKQKELDERNTEAMYEQLIAIRAKYNLDQQPEALEGLCEVAAEFLDYGIVPTMDQVAQEYMRRDTEHIAARDAKVLSKKEGDALLKYLGEGTVKRILAALEAQKAGTLKQIPTPQKVVKPRNERLPPREEKGRFVRETDFDKKFLGRR